MLFVFSFLLNQDKYFRLESINSPKIIVKSLLDYDVVQKISLVLHVQVQNSAVTEAPGSCSSLTSDP